MENLKYFNFRINLLGSLLALILGFFSCPFSFAQGEIDIRLDRSFQNGLGRIWEIESVTEGSPGSGKYLIRLAPIGYTHEGAEWRHIITVGDHTVDTDQIQPIIKKYGKDSDYKSIIGLRLLAHPDLSSDTVLNHLEVFAINNGNFRRLGFQNLGKLYDRVVFALSSFKEPYLEDIDVVTRSDAFSTMLYPLNQSVFQNGKRSKQSAEAFWHQLSEDVTSNGNRGSITVTMTPISGSDWAEQTRSGAWLDGEFYAKISRHDSKAGSTEITFLRLSPGTGGFISSYPTALEKQSYDRNLAFRCIEVFD